MSWRSGGLSSLMSLTAIALGLAQPTIAVTLYGTTLNQELIRIDPSTGSGTLVGLLNTGLSPFGLATRDRNLYTYDQTSSRLIQLDPQTARSLSSIDIGIQEDGEGDLAFRSDGVGFLAESLGTLGTLFSFDITPASARQVTPRNGLLPSLDGLAFNANDALFGLSQDEVDLYQIDPTSGNTTLVGKSGLQSGFVAGLTFAPDGRLYAAVNGTLYTLSSTTGAATPIGATGFQRVSGLAFLPDLEVPPPPEPGGSPVPVPPEPPSSVPEPAMSLGLLGLGLVGLSQIRQRNWRKS